MQKRYLEDEHDEILFLLPNELKTNKLYNVRPFSSQLSEDDDEDIEHFARWLEQAGQIHEVVINANHEIISGARRVKAFVINNEKRSKNCRPLLRIRCRVDRSPGDPRRKAIHANIQHKTLSLMDQLYLIHVLQKEHPDWSIEQIAEYMGIHRATVANILKLGTASPKLQADIHHGIISFHTALKIIRETPNVALQTVIIDKAKTVQMEINTEKILAQVDKKNISKKKGMRNLIGMKHTLRIEAPAIKQAIRELHQTDAEINLPPKSSPHRKRERTELLEGLNGLIPYTENGPRKHFLEWFVNVFAAGNGSMEELRKLWQIAIAA